MKNGETKKVQKIVINKKNIDLESILGENKKKAEIYYRSHLSSLLNDLGGTGNLKGGLEDYLNFLCEKNESNLNVCQFKKKIFNPVHPLPLLL